jgi:hypothetical protein
LGADFYGDLIDRGVDFVVRSRHVKEFEGIRKEGCAEFRDSVGDSFLLRVILVSLPSGEIEHLAASLPAAMLPRRMAKAFCFLRWPMGKASISPKQAGSGKHLRQAHYSGFSGSILFADNVERRICAQAQDGCHDWRGV